MHRIGAGVWRAGFRCVLARTPPEPKQKHRFLQCPRAFWRAPVGKVEQLLFWMRIEAEQQRERDLTRRSAARRTRILCASHKTAARFWVAQMARGSSAPVAQRYYEVAQTECTA